MNSAVLFLVFNRPDTTRQVFQAIRQARPPRLYVAADGPRPDRLGEADRVAHVREIATAVDWPCELKTLFREQNIGCKHAVSGAITWFFEFEAEGIILEDDCLPHSTFFRFCQEMLDRYRQDQRIGMISGDNFQFGRCYGHDSYYFSKYVHIWGWASWRDRWSASYDVYMTRWPQVRDQKRLEDLVLDKEDIFYWESIFDRVYHGGIDTWDYQWVFSNWVEGRLNILPSVNLISNIGFNSDATHTTGITPLAGLPATAIQFPLIHPIMRVRNVAADRFSGKYFLRPPIWNRIYSVLSSNLRRIVG